MKTTILSYSFTGNNDKLATALAKKLSANHVKISPQKPLSYFAIGMQMLFNSKPAINEVLPDLSKEELVIFVAPIWMGQIASPMRQCFKQLKGNITKYAFVSFSGGALGPNQKVEKELTKRMGLAPQYLLNRLIVEQLPQEPKPTPKDTEAYIFSNEDCATIVDEVVNSLNWNS